METESLLLTGIPGKEGIKMTEEQMGYLNDWDVWLEEMCIQLEKDKSHIVNEFDRRQFEK